MQEKFTDKLLQAALDKNAAFKSVCNAKKIENECLILKEQLEKQIEFLEELKIAFGEDKNSIKQLLSKQERLNAVELEVNVDIITIIK